MRDNLHKSLSDSNIHIISELPNSYDSIIKLINADKIWSETKGEGVKIMIIDAGVYVNHKDIKHSFRGGLNLIDKSKHIDDIHQHGTHVAGLIVGKKTGLSPNSELYVAKSLNNNGLGTMANVMDGITYAINSGVDIISMSLGSKFDLPIQIKNQIKNAYTKGITIVSASGNDGKHYINYPAKYEEVICVGGLNKEMKYAKFSNKGKELDITAPSENVLSTYGENEYAYMTGTSMASAITVGAIALLKSYYRKKGIELSPIDIKKRIKNLGCHSEFYGYGILNICELIKS